MVKQESIKVKVKLVFDPGDVEDARKNSDKDIPKAKMLKLNGSEGVTEFFIGEEHINPHEEYDFLPKGHRKKLIVHGCYLKIL